MNLSDFIFTIENVLSADEYYEVLDYCEETKDFNRTTISYEIEDTLRQRGERYDIYLKEGKIFQLIRKAFLYGLQESLSRYNHFLPKDIYTKVSGYWLLKYMEGDFLSLHNDFQADSGSITMTYNINEDYEGGDLIFWKNHKVETKKNTLHIFPSCFLYPHEITKVTRGIRYSAITWFGYDKGSRDI
jgi:hypothetical protein